MINRTAPKRRARAVIKIDGGAIRRRRHQLGETITSLAPRVPMSYGYLSQLECGWRTSVSPPMLDRLCKALAVQDPAELLIQDSA